VATPDDTPGVTLTLTSLTPPTPPPDPSTVPVTFRATVTNNTTTNYADLQISLNRGDPITQQSLLNQAIATPASAEDLDLAPVDLKTPLNAHSSAAVSYVSSPDSAHMCLCNSGVYPFSLSVSGSTGDGQPYTLLANTQVLVPSFQAKPAGVTVSWVWPLIDRPHRALSDSVFTDDELATSVAPNGRLYRALRTAALASAAGVQITLLVDPELLDSLEVMVGGYQVQQGSTKIAGTGGPAAASWLASFAALRASTNVVLTAYGDPDIDALTRANLPYTSVLSPQVQQRLAPVLGNQLISNLYWPINGVITAKARDAAVAAGAASLVLSDATLPSANSDTTASPGSTASSGATTSSNSVVANALAPLPLASGQANALVTDSTLQGLLADALAHPADLAADQQSLLAELAIRAEQDPTDNHFVVMTPDRYVDTNPATAAALMATISQNAWTTSIPIPDALNTVTPTARGPLTTVAGSQATEVPVSRLSTVAALDRQVSSLRQMLPAAAAQAQLGDFNDGVLRAESNGWRQDPAGAAALVAQLQSEAAQFSNGVQLIQPTNGTYTLSSQDSPVVVTVRNSLAEAATVRISVAPALGVLGFSAQTLADVVVPAHTRTTFSIPAHTSRLGQFKVVATLATPDGMQLGNGIALTLRSTAIGGITKVITGVAILILVLALGRRLYRRIRHPKASGGVGVAPAPPVPDTGSAVSQGRGAR
jgi:hypothetical protein